MTSRSSGSHRAHVPSPAALSRCPRPDREASGPRDRAAPSGPERCRRFATRGRLEPAVAPVLGLGPLGVLPGEQRRGVGSALVHALLAVAEACDERLVALLGDPAYYRRLGFRPAADLGVTPPDPRWGAHFQARLLAGEPVEGAFRYAAPFDRLLRFSPAPWPGRR